MGEDTPEGPGTEGSYAPPRPPGPVPAGYVPAGWAGWAPPVATMAPNLPDAPFLDVIEAVPATKRQAWRWLLYAVVGFLVGQILGAVFGTVAGSLAGKDAAQMRAITTANVPPEWYIVATLVGLWIGFGGAPWLASRTQGTRRFLRDLGVRFKLIDLVGIGIGLGAQIVVAIIYAPFRHDIHNFNGPSQKLTGGSHGGGFLIIAVATVVVAPFFEELFFRGLLFKALARLFTPTAVTATVARRAGVVLAVVVDGLLFGVAHGEWVQLAGLALFGMALAAISYRTGRLGMNMVSHASFNLVAILVILSQPGNGVIH
jgi:membrane protease YdiL (CAAX protease family)